MAASSRNELHVLGQLFRAAVAIDGALGKLHGIYGSELGITGPQWTILAVIFEMGAEKGMLVKDVAKALNVERSFVTAQSNVLEATGYLERRSCPSDRRLVYLALSSRAERELTRLARTLASIDIDARKRICTIVSSRLLGDLTVLEKSVSQLGVYLTISER